MPLDVDMDRRRVAFGAATMSTRSLSSRRSLAAAVFTLVSVIWSGVALSQTAIRSNFDHDSTSFRLDGAHVAAGCGDCHRRGTFASTLRECEYCHSQGGIVTATFKPARHINTTQRCESCHSTRSFIPLERMDHNETYGACVSCHDNNTALGKPVDHPPASDQCQSCHLTVAFSPVVRFDHTGVTGNCVSCHDNVVATGKPANHIPATNVCEDCHRTTSWTLVSFEHLQVLGTCSSCHDGIIARGMDADHVPTTAECDSCHNTTAF